MADDSADEPRPDRWREAGEAARESEGPADDGTALEREALDGAPDVYLNVPVLKVDEIGIEVDDLEAHVSLAAAVLDLLKLNVGADAFLGKVNLEIKGVEAQARLEVRLDKVALIVDRVLTTLDRNPEILQHIGRGVESAARGIGTGAGQAVGELGKGAGGAVQGVGEGAGRAVQDVGEGAGQAAGELGKGAGEAAKGVGGAAGDTVGDVERGVTGGDGTRGGEAGREGNGRGAERDGGSDRPAADDSDSGATDVGDTSALLQDALREARRSVAGLHSALERMAAQTAARRDGG
jgi:hypothetical protein